MTTAPSTWWSNLPDVIDDPLFGKIPRTFGSNYAIYKREMPFGSRFIQVKLVTYSVEALAQNMESAKRIYSNLHLLEEASRVYLGKALRTFIADSGAADLPPANEYSTLLSLCGIFVRDDCEELHFNLSVRPGYVIRIALKDGNPSQYFDVEY